ncbi:protein adenylyltransferase SelO family protein [Govanella unica]|uniref:Protein nucleotidyltransferase YdiU n=1 Tax=Govanella unica TaxID=2975056 RepID=A0A9X3TZ23_9PROT|nr:YdiU family protein [Govania unica]MDA5194384.1 YdiU family protein [Govania unica]
MPVSADYRPEAALLTLGDGFYDLVAAAAFPQHVLRFRNDRAAASIGLDGLSDAEWIAHFGRFEPLPDTLPGPLSLRYHGHQFRTYNPDLGDGRGFSFAQMRERGTGRLLELGTKGSGQTPWSRSGDGRLTLKGGLREILATEMLEAQGVTTSKSLSLIETGEALQRGDEPSPTRSSVLVRLGYSHVRIGTFQRQAFYQDAARIQELLDYCRRWLIPDFQTADEFLHIVIGNVARMGAEWMAAGFVHGVLNTDNTNIMGESFDYGPWRWLPTLDPNFTAAYFDHSGLYSFGRQLEALYWNLQRLAECLLLVGDRDKLVRALQDFPLIMDRELRAAYLRRLGVRSRGETEDDDLLRDFNGFLHASQVGYEQAFFDWQGGVLSADRAAASPEAQTYAGEAFATFRQRLEGYEAVDPARLNHDYFKGARPESMLIDEVESLWAPIALEDDWSAFYAKLDRVAGMRVAYGG